MSQPAPLSKLNSVTRIPKAIIGDVRRRLSSSSSLKKFQTNDTTNTKDTENVDTVQAAWESLSDFLVQYKLSKIQSLPHTILMATEAENEAQPFVCPQFETEEEYVTEVEVLKRFNSRKMPHLIEIRGSLGSKRRYIFKQGDDIRTDAAVMEMFKLASVIWSEGSAHASTRTYTIVPTQDGSAGFVEVVPGQPIMRLHTPEILDILICPQNKDKISRIKWETFYTSVVGMVVNTAAFEITDRHHGNTLLADDGTVTLIDMTDSLGKKTVVDSTLNISPIYIPARIRNVLVQVANMTTTNHCEHIDTPLITEEFSSSSASSASSSEEEGESNDIHEAELPLGTPKIEEEESNDMHTSDLPLDTPNSTDFTRHMSFESATTDANLYDDTLSIRGWSTFQTDCIQAYTMLWENQTVQERLEEIGYHMMSPEKFRHLLNIRCKARRNSKSKVRNSLVLGMEENPAFAIFVKGFCSTTGVC